MIIDQVYKQLRDDNVCRSAYQFSKQFLQKSPSYYSVIKSRNIAPSFDALLALEATLLETAQAYTSNRYPFFIRTRKHLLAMHSAVSKHRQQQVLLKFINNKSPSI